jgi:site-specific DNA recombinase
VAKRERTGVVAKQLRAAGYCRTSGEGQRDNTSIPSQKEAIAAFCKREGWPVAEYYVDECRSGAKVAGRDEFQRLMRDAALGKFDVVVVYQVSRWGRDGTDILDSCRTLKRDFGVDVIETSGTFDTRKRTNALMNFVGAGFAEQERLTILERTIGGRIKRAKEGGAGVGRLPYGRSYDKITKRWTNDPEKKRFIEDVARRYLAGESIEAIAKETGVNAAGLLRTLTRRCGTTWEQEFQPKELDIHERFETSIPALLPPETIRAIHARVAANKTYHHGQAKNKYLLGRMVFCGTCGYALHGATTRHGRRYYRHGIKELQRSCTAATSWVRADDLEDAVLRHLFNTFGNPAAVEKAIAAALPDLDAARQLQERMARLDGWIVKETQGQEKVGRLAMGGSMKEALAAKLLTESQAKIDAWQQEREGLSSKMANAPTADQVRGLALKVASAYKRVSAKEIKLAARKQVANSDFSGMTFEQRRDLCQRVFAGKTLDGKRMGVYITWTDGGKKATYTIRGLVTESGILPMGKEEADWLVDPERIDAVEQKKVLTRNTCS